MDGSIRQRSAGSWELRAYVGVSGVPARTRARPQCRARRDGVACACSVLSCVRRGRGSQPGFPYAGRDPSSRSRRPSPPQSLPVPRCCRAREELDAAAARPRGRTGRTLPRSPSTGLVPCHPLQLQDVQSCNRARAPVKELQRSQIDRSEAPPTGPSFMTLRVLAASRNGSTTPIRLTKVAERNNGYSIG